MPFYTWDELNGANVKPVIDEALLSAMRRGGSCELCGVPCPARVPHHVIRKGMGGGRRFDVAANLLSLGPPGVCRCHDLVHAGRIPLQSQIDAVAAREQRDPEDVADELGRLRWGRSTA